MSILKPLNGDQELIKLAIGVYFDPAMTSGVSSSNISNSGTLLINSNGTLGDAASLAQVRLQNQTGGTLTVYSTPTINGYFTNVGALSLRTGANLQVQGTATQTGGTTVLQGGTISVDPGPQAPRFTR